jgi:hypothetical protein
MNRRQLLGTLGSVLVAGAALAPDGQASSIGLQFASKKPGTNTAMTLHIHYTKAGDPKAKPSPIRRIQIDAPAGTVFHTSTVAACDASDAEVRLFGPGACPSASRIGAGPISVITGFGPPFDPFVVPTPVFNDGRGWLEISQIPSTPITIAVTRLTVTGSRISASVSPSPGGPPDWQSAVSTVDLSFPAATHYITTPPTCPAGGRWVTTGTFTFADGTTQVVKGETPCRRARIRVALRPPHVRAGERARVSVALSSTDSRCVSNAAVRLSGNRDIVRSNRSGHATLVARFRGSGRRTVTASKPGCRVGAASLTVLG